MNQGDFELSIIVDNCRLEESWDEKTAQAWIAAKTGQEFSLLLGNRGTGRAMGVTTVDGLSIHDGKPGSYRSPGYIIRPKSHIIVPGWRIDNTTVAHFAFGKRKKGYVSLIGQAKQNIGVIAAAFYCEKTLTEAEIRSETEKDIAACQQLGDEGSDLHRETVLYTERHWETRSRIWKLAAERQWPEGLWLVAVAELFSSSHSTDKHARFIEIQQAADAGLNLAQFTLGYCYEEGIGIQQSYLKAAQWYRKASANGIRQARERAEECERPKESQDSEYDDFVALDEGVCLMAFDDGPLDPEPTTDDVAVGFGRKTEHHITTSIFRRATKEPEAVITIRYDTKRSLKKRGIGCPIPEGWRG